MTDAAAKDAEYGLEAIIAMDRSVLVARWAIAFGSPAPRNCQVTLLRGALTWHYQLTCSAKNGSTGIESHLDLASNPQRHPKELEKYVVEFLRRIFPAQWPQDVQLLHRFAHRLVQRFDLFFSVQWQAEQQVAFGLTTVKQLGS